MTPILQFEIDKKRLYEFANVPDSKYDGYHAPTQHVWQLAQAALRDTFEHGGTFVMVISDKKITIVQRTEASDFDEEAPK